MRSLFLKESLLFGGIQALALLVAGRLPPRFLATPQPQPATEASLVLLSVFAAAIVLLLVFSRGRTSRVLIRVVWLAALFGGTQILFAAFMPQDIATLIALALTLVYWRAATIGFHNFMLVLALPGIGAVLGSSLTPNAALAVLAFLSLYDVLAVYWTGHMIAMAKDFIASGVVPGIVVIPEVPAEVTGPKEEEPVFVTEVIPGGRATILGTGDLVIPTVLETSALLSVGTLSGILTAIFAVLGLFVMHILFWKQKVRRPMAALPPIAAGAITGFLLSLLI